MGVIIFLFILGIIYYITFTSDGLMQQAKQYKDGKNKMYKEKGFNWVQDSSFKLHYKGGIKNLSVQMDTTIDILKEGLNFIYSEKRVEEDNNNKQTILQSIYIDFSDIKSIEIQTESSIKSQVSLGKLLFFGVLAFGMKRKEKESIQEYIVLKVADEEGDYGVVLSVESLIDQASYTNRVVQEAYNELEELRQEYCNQLEEDEEVSE